MERGTAERAWATLACVVAAISVATTSGSDWVPLDEGTIGLSARMVAAGYLPHRDFAYPYTGALAYWHALAYAVGGDSLLSARVAVLVPFVLWLPAVWALARRFVGVVNASATVIACAWWSLLVYPASMPTWYVLFTTTWALAAIIRWAETGRHGWLIGAGALAGVAITVKQTGLYTLVGCGLGVLALERWRAAHTAQHSALPFTGRRDRLVMILLAVAAAVPVLLIDRRGLLSGETLVIAAPFLLLLLALAWREPFRAPGQPSGRRPLLIAWGMLVAGAAIPVLALVAWYAFQGALPALAAGALGGGIRTAGVISRPIPEAATIVGYGLPVALIAAIAGIPARPGMRLMTGGATALGISLAAMFTAPAYRALWLFVVLLSLFVAAGIAWRARLPEGRHEALALAIALAGTLLSFNQFPYGAPNYFAYVAPLVILAAVALSSLWPAASSGAGPARLAGGLARSPFVLLALLLFGGWYHRIGGVRTVGEGSVWWDDAHRLPSVHGGIRVPAADSATYARVLELVAMHSGPDGFLAGPELPELYVLAGTTRLVPQPYLLIEDPAPDSAAIAAAVDTSRVRAVIIRDDPLFLPQLRGEAAEWIRRRYPGGERVGTLEVRWR